MASARNEATKAPGAEGAEGVGVRRGCPLPTRGGLWGGGYAPSPEFFSILELKMSSFGAFWELILLQ